MYQPSPLPAFAGEQHGQWGQRALRDMEAATGMGMGDVEEGCSRADKGEDDDDEAEAEAEAEVEGEQEEEEEEERRLQTAFNTELVKYKEREGKYRAAAQETNELRAAVTLSSLELLRIQGQMRIMARDMDRVLDEEEGEEEETKEEGGVMEEEEADMQRTKVSRRGKGIGDRASGGMDPTPTPTSDEGKTSGVDFPISISMPESDAQAVRECASLCLACWPLNNI
ncbi:X-linked retinitis pigmentosa GTPase regulator [Colletotrichum tofieldiae]|nr:X-linked retinitis pigmentosa GTPase regulator [Colletotrichum tofieldiae]